tara:strand:- start:55011 stop:55811 length:801 start_codon:yes stop_codon:yes gene_type:complete
MTTKFFDLQLGMVSQYNTMWQVIGVDQVTLSANNVLEAASEKNPGIIMTYAEGTPAPGNIHPVTLPANPKILDMTITGLGGCRIAEAATGYEIYLVSDGDGDNRLIAEQNGTSLTYANLAALDPAFIYKSKVIGFVSNVATATDASAGDLIPAFGRDQNWFYVSEHGGDKRILGSGSAAVYTAVSWTDIVPAHAAYFDVQAVNAGVGGGSFYISLDGGTTDHIRLRADQTGSQLVRITNALTGEIHYYRSSGTNSLHLDIYGFTIY